MSSMILFSLFILVLFIFFLKIGLHWLHILKRRNTVPQHIKKSFKIFSQLYNQVTGTTLSLAERKRLQLEDSSFTYGEILPGAFAAILEVVKPKTGDIFFDLGCGTGKAVFCAALLYDWKKCCGVEFLPALYECCLAQLKKFSQLSDVKKYFPQKKFSVEFIQGDMLSIHFSDADVLFLHATTFAPELWEALKEKLLLLKKGARVIVVTKRLDEMHFKKIDEKVRPMTWGETTVFIYEKLQDPMTTH